MSGAAAQKVAAPIMSLSESEGAKYRAVWGNAQYRVVSPGTRHLQGAIQWMAPKHGASFTDWGCGTGRVAEELSELGFDVRLVDIAPNAYVGTLPFTQACLWELPESLEPTEYGFCADVMEHIPTEHVDGVFAGIAARTRKKCFFQIALFHDNYFRESGPLHLSVFPPEWWQDKIAKHYRHAEYRMVKRKHLLAVVS
jgi:hypothetical protein